MSLEDDAIESLLAADPPEDPVGMALCLLTIDLQRVGGNPVDEMLLRRMLPRYLSADVDDTVFRGRPGMGGTESAGDRRLRAESVGPV